MIVGGISGCEGRLVRKGKKGIIRVSDAIPEVGRQRFAFAHELGHWEFHARRNGLYAQHPALATVKLSVASIFQRRSLPFTLARA